jgi:hypothetical protein
MVDPERAIRAEPARREDLGARNGEVRSSDRANRWGTRKHKREASIRQFGDWRSNPLATSIQACSRPVGFIGARMLRDLSTSDDSRLTAKCSVCVVGGGIAGLIAASRLSASGRRVIVLESGDRKPLDRLDAFNAVEQVGETYRTAVTGRVRALGGTSNTWGGRIMPLAPHDMAPRDYLGLSGWPIERADLDRYVPEIERLFRLDQSSYEELPASPLNPNDSLLGGRPHMIPRWSKWPTFRRRNVAHLLRDMVVIKRDAEIWLNATVCDVLFDAAAGRLTGVEARSINGRRLTVLADWFVLAAGTFETTRLLLQLDELTDGRAFSECDALGRYFNDHLKIEAGRVKPLDSRQTNLAFGYHIGGSTRRSVHVETSAAAQREDQAGSGYVTIRAEFPPLSIHHYVRNLGNRFRLGGSSSLCRNTGWRRIWGAWVRPSIGEFDTNKCTLAQLWSFSSTRGSSKRQARVHALRSPSSETGLARRCCRWAGGRRLSTTTPCGRFCCVRVGFGSPLFFTLRALSPGQSIRTRRT